MHGMTTDHGRKFVVDRLTSARDLAELAAVWSTIAIRYQREPSIYELKERLKAQMERAK
jgi:hypothetical protein